MNAVEADIQFRLSSDIAARKFVDEDEIVDEILGNKPYDRRAAAEISGSAAKLVSKMRESSDQRPIVDTFLKEYGLSNQEGVALMCLAESLLRVPDRRTADLLIADKIASADWADHAGKADALLVNASTWGLILTGRLVSVEHAFTSNPKNWIRSLAGKIGEPVIRKAMRSAMHILGRVFVLGRTIDEALERSSEGLYSYDMLGEAARDEKTASKYFDAYATSIKTVGASKNTGASVSIKLSALHPRFEALKHARVMTELRERVLHLCTLAKRHDVQLTVDAEEADRQDLTLEVFASAAQDPELADWDGLGIVVQAYSKRALPVLEELARLAGVISRRIPVRLVKGAYWDAEIKHAQELGLPGFPVFTRKANSDLSYLVCAKFLLENTTSIYPQFATHNAHTICAVMHMAGDVEVFEFQRLHGMGDLVYASASEYYSDFPLIRTYAPVGGYKDLLAYLVRRLLENGANSSFVNRFLDETVSPESLCQCPIKFVEESQRRAHPGIPLAKNIYQPDRDNSAGIDLSDSATISRIEESLSKPVDEQIRGVSIVSGRKMGGSGIGIRNPANHEERIGERVDLSELDVRRIFDVAAAKQPEWNALGVDARADILARAADRLELEKERFIWLLVKEAGKTVTDAVAEIREAVDFCRYYAQQARKQYGAPVPFPGPTGELNEMVVSGRGVFVCVSPWNFPLAIFVGQIAAALVTGNAVVAKPAEETPLIAVETVLLLLDAGVPGNILHLAMGGGRIGAELASNSKTAGVAFTGSTDTARRINQTLAARDAPIAPLIAETGGQNAMFVDSTAMLEQVTDDVISSAFLSAGQRCSAMRVLYLQEEVADEAIALIQGAMKELRVGDPSNLATDVGPIISEAAAADLQDHITDLTDRGMHIYSTPASRDCRIGTFVTPALFEIPDISVLKKEHFGPILHVIRYSGRQFDAAVDSALGSGYGLTLGLHSRMESRASTLFNRATVGNVYVNRNMIGAVVGTQPFGGQGLSGTGPKAGGPNYLQRFVTEKTLTINTVATGGNTALLSLEAPR